MDPGIWDEGKCSTKVKDGSVRLFRESDLRFKTDSATTGPEQGTAAFVSAGVMGDRVFRTFTDAEEITGVTKNTC